MNLTQKQLSRRWKIGASTVSKLLSHPDAPKPTLGGRYDAGACDAYRRERLALAGRLDGDTSMAEIRRKQEARKLELLDIDVAVKRGDLVPVAEVVQNARADASLIRTSMSGMAAALAPQLVGKQTPEEVRVILADWAHSTLLGWAVAAGNTSLGDQIKAPHE
jgi:hypothetical protein